MIVAALLFAVAFDDAVVAVENHDFRRAHALYAQAITTDADPHRRDIARLRLANIEWRIEHDAAAARATLAGIDAQSEEFANAWTERARIDAELTGDFAAARTEAGRALALATKREDRMRATIVHAFAAVEPSRRAKEPDLALVRAAETELRDVPLLDAVQLRLDAAILANDGPGAVAAWRAYYRLDANAPLPSFDDRRRFGLALADAKLFSAAALVLRNLTGDDVAEVLRYEESLRRIETITNEYYRQVALGKGDARMFKRDVEAVHLPTKYGALVNLGTTGGVFDLHLAHPVLDEDREVTQYGRTAKLHFVSLDGVVSNGFGTWMRDGGGGDGGWATDTVIYQVRPMYADGPLRDWLRVTDNAMRAETERRIAEETQRDEERAAKEAVRDFPGMALRLRRQYDEATLAALRAKGLSGDELRNAFLSRIASDTFDSSIWAHEGRHAIDKKYKLASGAAELEYRAKLSEITFAPAPRGAITSSILGGMIGTNTPHGIADKRALDGVVAWMRAHAADIAGLDANKPLLPQLDKLSDEQLRQAFRSLDPLAHTIAR